MFKAQHLFLRLQVANPAELWSAKIFFTRKSWHNLLWVLPWPGESLWFIRLHKGLWVKSFCWIPRSYISCRWLSKGHPSSSSSSSSTTTNQVPRCPPIVRFLKRSHIAFTFHLGEKKTYFFFGEINGRDGKFTHLSHTGLWKKWAPLKAFILPPKFMSFPYTIKNAMITESFPVSTLEASVSWMVSGGVLFGGLDAPHWKVPPDAPQLLVSAKWGTVSPPVMPWGRTSTNNFRH